MTYGKMISFKGTELTKQEIDNAAVNLGMSASELIRTAIDHFIDSEPKEAQEMLLLRTKPYFTHGNPDRAIVEIKALLDGMNLSGMRTWGDSEIAPEDTFKIFVELKMKAA